MLQQRNRSPAMSAKSNGKALKSEHLITRVSPEVKAKVVEVAERLDLSEAQFLRRAIVKALADTAQAA